MFASCRHHLFWFRLLRLLLVAPALANAYAPLSDQSLHDLPDPGSDFDIKDGAILSPILRPRVPGTPGSTAVLNHIASFFRKSLPKWTLEFQNSTSKTPATGDTKVPFVNLIARRDPPWAKTGDVGRLNLVAHYDSKFTPEGFIGATDSAAPCAMIMHAARSVDEALTKKWDAMEADGAASDVGGSQGVQVLLLDGEEAFVTWSDDDSLSLASNWEQTAHPALSTYRTPLSSIDLFVLLDLLGASSPRIPSYYPTTHWAYQSLAKLEQRLRSLSLFQSSPNHPSKSDTQRDDSGRHHQHHRAASAAEPLFLPQSSKTSFSPTNHIEDDHIPFLARGVEVLHLIPIPFPSVWHQMSDDGEHLDMDVTRDWAILVTAFVAEWMELDEFIKGTKEAGNENTRREKEWLDPNDVIISKTEL
ncbi:MAG: hypothetical protein M1837_002423 [Sclerophora amabilis]|nr:MAG: hypothetical protein M1837_002423 [Sclerophora amabilis]